jgi:intracellular multiplication protein IcmL
MVDAGSGPSGGPSKGEGGSPAPAAAAGKGAPVAKKKAVSKADADNLLSAPLLTVLVPIEFYRDGFRNLMWLVLGEAIIIIAVLTTFIAYMNSAKAQDRYFATTADGRITSMVPLELPNMGTPALLSWAAAAGTEVMTFGDRDYQRKLQYSSRHFTRNGWGTFATMLQKSRIIESMVAQHQSASAEERGAVVVKQGVFNGKYRWVVNLPMTVKYQSDTNPRTDNMTVTLVIDRVPSLENPSGLGIEEWSSTVPATKEPNSGP